MINGKIKEIHRFVLIAVQVQIELQSACIGTSMRVAGTVLSAVAERMSRRHA